MGRGLELSHCWQSWPVATSDSAPNEAHLWPEASPEIRPEIEIAKKGPQPITVAAPPNVSDNLMLVHLWPMIFGRHPGSELD